MGPLEADKPWNNDGVSGARKFLDRVWRLFAEDKKVDAENKNLEKIYHQTVKKVTEDYESLSFNTAISQLMIFVNTVNKEESFPMEYRIGFIKLLNPIAPHITEELWSMLGNNDTIAYESWPVYDESKLVVDEIEIGVQVNGKLRGSIKVTNDTTEEDMVKLALENENVSRHTEGKEIIKTIVIKRRIVNIVVK